MQVEVDKIRVKEGRRGLDVAYVQELAGSIRELGLPNPVTVDKDCRLIAGLHRLEAVKMLGLPVVECTVSSLEGLKAELAEIDENIVRSDISAVEYGEVLLRRKEIYETLHPESKATYEGGGFKGNQYREVVADKMAATTKSFVEDTAEKLGIAPRTVRREIQTARNLTPEAKKIVKDKDMKITKKAALRLSQMEPEEQKEAAKQLAAGEICSVEEYAKAAKKVQEETGEPKEEMPGKKRTGLKEVVADLKNTERDCGGTPESFLAEYAAFVEKFHKEIGWYSNPYYNDVFPRMDGAQLAALRGYTDAICTAAEELFHKAEGMVKK